MNAPPLPLPKKNLIVYCLGGAFHWFHEIFMRRLGYRPDFFVDRTMPTGSVFEGIPAFSDIGPRIPMPDRGRYTVVVCAGKEEAFLSIQAALVRDGFQSVVWLHQLYEVHDPFELSRHDFDAPGAAQREENIFAARALLEDALSREIFDRFIETHQTRIPVVIPKSPADEQYFPSDIGTAVSMERLVLCGAGSHDLSHVAQKITSPIESLAVFEADPHVFRSLANDNRLAGPSGQIRGLARTFSLSPCAVCSATEIRPFISCRGFGSRLHPDGSRMVQTIALDQAILGIEPSYICMDIEGAELEAVTGARRIIESSRTDLAISVYHKASHIWEIPLLIHTFNPDYRLHLRNYTGFCAETILYAST